MHSLITWICHSILNIKIQFQLFFTLWYGFSDLVTFLKIGQTFEIGQIAYLLSRFILSYQRNIVCIPKFVLLLSKWDFWTYVVSETIHAF